MADTYWRVDTGRPNQSKPVALQQQSTNKVCGRGSHQSGADVSSIPTVKAYYGRLPANQHGIEFETSLAPRSIQRVQGGTVPWPQGCPGVLDEGNGLVCIPVFNLTLRY